MSAGPVQCGRPWCGVPSSEAEQQGVLGSQQGKKKEEAAGCLPHFRLALRQWGPSLYVWGKTAAVGGGEQGGSHPTSGSPIGASTTPRGTDALSIRTHGFLDAKHHP